MCKKTFELIKESKDLNGELVERLLDKRREAQNRLTEAEDVGGLLEELEEILNCLGSHGVEVVISEVKQCGNSCK